MGKSAAVEAANRGSPYSKFVFSSAGSAAAIYRSFQTGAMTVSLASQNVRRSKPDSSGSMRANSNDLPHLEHGGRSLSANLHLGCLSQSSVFDVTRKQFDQLSGLGKRQFRPQEGSELLNDPMPLQVNLPSDGIAIEPNDMNGVTRHPAGHPADVRRSLDIECLAIPIDLV